MLHLFWVGNLLSCTCNYTQKKKKLKHHCTVQQLEVSKNKILSWCLVACYSNSLTPHHTIALALNKGYKQQLVSLTWYTQGNNLLDFCKSIRTFHLFTPLKGCGFMPGFFLAMSCDFLKPSYHCEMQGTMWKLAEQTRLVKQ